VTLRDQFAVVGRRWRLVALFVILGVLGSLAYIHTRKPAYVSNAEVRLQPVTSSPFQSSSVPPATAIAMPTEQRVATSATIADAAAKLIGTGITGGQALKHLTVTVPVNSQILNFAYSAATPKAAQTGASAFERAYRANREATNAAQVQTLQGKLTKERNQLQNQRQGLLDQLGRTSNSNVIATLNNEISSLTTSLAANAQAAASLDTVDPAGATLSQAPTLPSQPSGTSSAIILAIGFVVGLALGLTVAFIVDATDDHLHGPADLAALTGAPVLTRVPLLRNILPWRKHDLAAEGTSHPKVAEAYRLLANRLIVLARSDSIGSILIASPAQGEGRSSVAANLSATFVDLGFRVWLVSADLMPPQVHRLFSPNDVPGLMSVLPMAEAATDEQAPSSELALGVGGSTGGASSGHLTLMSSTGRERSVGRLLSPLVLTKQIQENQRLVDLTIVDAPALLEFADAVPLLPVVDGVVVVADAGATRRSELEELADLLDHTGARVIGSVLNRDGSRVVSRRARRARHRTSSEQAKAYSRRAAWARGERNTSSRSQPQGAGSGRRGRTHSRQDPGATNGTARSADDPTGAEIFTNRPVRPVTILPNDGQTPEGDVGWPA
jgi:Mrp family chromosome partitioning ATPase/capsular polysaccharide biosynthesis protein